MWPVCLIVGQIRHKCIFAALFFAKLELFNYGVRHVLLILKGIEVELCVLKHFKKYTLVQFVCSESLEWLDTGRVFGNTLI